MSTNEADLAEAQLEEARALEGRWKTHPYWDDISRPYSSEDVIRLRGSFRESKDLAEAGAIQLRRRVEQEEPLLAMGALDGTQAIQMVRAGLEAIYVSGWQTGAGNNPARDMFSDRGIYPSDGVPHNVRQINNALLRADQIEWSEGRTDRDWLVPIVADGEAGHGGIPNTYEFTLWLLEAGAAAIHLEDQLPSQKKCGHMGGKVLVPTGEHVRRLHAARLAADVAGVPLVLIARTDSRDASFLASDVDPRDQEILSEGRTTEGYHRISPTLQTAVERGLAYAPHADMLWFETKHPDLDEAERFADQIHREYPGKALVYNCSPAFNWREKVGGGELEHFRENLMDMGYVFQFISIAGFHANAKATFEIARDYKEEGMNAYAALQQDEQDLEEAGYTAIRHDHEVGDSYFDLVQKAITGGAETSSMEE